MVTLKVPPVGRAVGMVNPPFSEIVRKSVPLLARVTWLDRPDTVPPTLYVVVAQTTSTEAMSAMTALPWWPFTVQVWSAG
ncbi:hypothetical protein D3C85_1437850 [compost metagenome]